VTWQDDFDRDMENLRKAWLDLSYLIFKNTGVIWLAQRFGMKLKPWVKERQGS
jgi:hypothetical protein